MYQKDVIKYIKKHPEVIKENIAEKLRNLKYKYHLILLTTNTQDYINKILKVSHLEDIYDDIIASRTEKEPNKEGLIKELVKKYGIPKYYITGKEDLKVIEKFRELGVTIIDTKSIKKII